MVEQFEQREVVLGMEASGWTEIRRGLKAGESVITTGSFYAKTAALRELIEETGYHATKLDHLADCPSSPGLTSEVVSYFLAKDVTRLLKASRIG